MTSIAQSAVVLFNCRRTTFFGALRNQADLESQEAMLLREIQIQLFRYQEQKSLVEYNIHNPLAKDYLTEMHREIDQLFTKVGKIRYELGMIDTLKKNYHESLRSLRSLQLTPDDACGDNLAIRQILENAALSVSTDKLEQKEYDHIANRISNLSK